MSTENIELIAVLCLFAALRFGGYWLYLRYLVTHGYPASAPPAAMAFARMAVGLVAGGLLVAALGHAFVETLPQVVVGVVGQFLLRLAIWAAIFRMFFKKVSVGPYALGVFVSYVLDVPSAIVTAMGLIVAMKDMRFC